MRDKTFYIRNITVKRFTYIVIITTYLYFLRNAYRHNSILRHFSLYIYYVKKNIWGGTYTLPYLYATIQFTYRHAKTFVGF